MSRAAVFTAILLIFSAATAFGQNGQNTVPPPVLPPYPLNAPATGAVDCYNNATTYGLMTADQAYQLCEGSATSVPYDCFRAATRSLVDDQTALKLCRCAISTSRVDCYNQAHATTSLSENDILGLCTHDARAPGCS